MTALLEIFFDKLRDRRCPAAFANLTYTSLQSQLDNIARELEGTNKTERAETDAQDPHAYRNILKYILQNEFRKTGASRDRQDSERHPSQQGPSEPVLSGHSNRDFTVTSP